MEFDLNQTIVSRCFWRIDLSIFGGFLPEYHFWNILAVVFKSLLTALVSRGNCCLVLLVSPWMLYLFVVFLIFFEELAFPRRAVSNTSKKIGPPDTCATLRIFFGVRPLTKDLLVPCHGVLSRLTRMFCRLCVHVYQYFFDLFLVVDWLFVVDELHLVGSSIFSAIPGFRFDAAVCTTRHCI